MFDYISDLGFTESGRKLMGYYDPKTRTLGVDRSLFQSENDPRLYFTLAHEFGHFILHDEAPIDWREYANASFQDAEIDFATGHKKLVTARDWIEWQANYFASALLVPKPTIESAVRSEQVKLGIPAQNQGRIFVDDNDYSLADFKDTIAALCEIYSVSHAVMRHRLEELGILVDGRMSLT